MPSAAAAVMRHVVGVIGRRLAAADTPEGKRQVVDRSSTLFAPCLGVHTTPSDVGDHGGLEIVPFSGLGAGRTVLLFHGGGYVFGSPDGYRSLAGRIAKATAATVLVPRYRLAPEHPYPVAVEDGLAAYRWVVERHGTDALVVGGDSAGGGMTVAVLQAARDEGLPLPAAAFLISPWLDLTGTAESRRTNADTELLVLSDTIVTCNAWYRGPRDGDDPGISPLFGSMHGLPPVLVQVTTGEALESDSFAFADAARAAGVDVTLEVEQGLWHVWQLMAPMLPEARASIAGIGRFVAERLR